MKEMLIICKFNTSLINIKKTIVKDFQELQIFRSSINGLFLYLP